MAALPEILPPLVSVYEVTPGAGKKIAGNTGPPMRDSVGLFIVHGPLPAAEVIAAPEAEVIPGETTSKVSVTHEHTVSRVLVAV